MRYDIVALGLIALAGSAENALGEGASAPVRYECKNEKWIEARYFAEPVPYVSIRLSDGRRMNLAQVLSASGTRYANIGETIELRNKGNAARLEEGELGGESITTFEDCLEKQ